MKKLVIAASLAALFSAGAALAETIKIGVTPGPHAQIMEEVKKVAAEKGLELDILEFSDYVVPNPVFGTEYSAVGIASQSPKILLLAHGEFLEHQRRELTERHASGQRFPDVRHQRWGDGPE